MKSEKDQPRKISIQETAEAYAYIQLTDFLEALDNKSKKEKE